MREHHLVDKVMFPNSLVFRKYPSTVPHMDVILSPFTFLSALLAALWGFTVNGIFLFVFVVGSQSW